MARSLFTRSKGHKALRTQLLRELEKEARQLLTQMSDEFSESLSKETQHILSQALKINGSGSGPDLFSGRNSTDAFSSDSVLRLFSTATQYFFSRPKTSISTRETDRSQGMAANFRPSRRQAMNEAVSNLSRGDKNA